MEKVWLITGCSRGIGRVLVEEVLDKGGKVIATARDILSIQDLVEPERCVAMRLDVNDIDSIPAVIQSAWGIWGRIDVVVNNAGYGLLGAIEELSMAQVRAQMETNFFGLLAVTQAVTPYLRQQGSGWIVNVSSMAGMRGMASLGAYNASKFAVEGLTEALHGELAPFGIRVSAIEPGPYRTDWAGSSLDRSEAIDNETSDSPYHTLNMTQKAAFEGRSGKQPGDPRQIASVLVEAAAAPSVPMHMVFGDIAIAGYQDRLRNMEAPAFARFFPHDQFHY
jgi:NAD(P)-dependent dehydrogenase (short-subunit alcohol dehydrogenase family)